MIKDKIKRTPAKWEQIIGVKILSPDGWRYRHGQLVPKSLERKISRREFYRRRVLSSEMPRSEKGVQVMQCHKCHKELKDGIKSGAFGRYLCVDCFITKWKVQPKQQQIISFDLQLELSSIIKTKKGGVK